MLEDLKHVFKSVAVHQRILPSKLVSMVLGGIHGKATVIERLAQSLRGRGAHPVP